MRKVTRILILLMVLFTPIVSADDITVLRNLGYVVVSPQGPTDGGNFGPFTPNTQTSGIQEAFDYAKQNNFKEVYIIGGGGNTAESVVYNLSTTLTIPWFQNWHCTGGNYIMNFTQTSGDCLVIDSQMNCLLTFGTISAPNLTAGSIVKIAPVTEGPDTYVVYICCVTNITAIRGKGENYATGLYLTGGNTGGSKFTVGQIENCQIGLRLDSNVNGNEINCNLIRHCGTMIKSNPSSGNIIYAAMEVEDAAGTVIGASIESGQQNMYTLTWLDSFSPGNSLIFGNSAQDNLIFAMNLPIDGVTNNASNPTNCIIPLQSAGYRITTPPIAGSGNYITNTTSYSVIATIVTAGSVSTWITRDSAGTEQTISGPLLAGQTFYLEPGDSIKFYYTAPPTWRWKALR